MMFGVTVSSKRDQTYLFHNIHWRLFVNLISDCPSFVDIPSLSIHPSIHVSKPDSFGSFSGFSLPKPPCPNLFSEWFIVCKCMRTKCEPGFLRGGSEHACQAAESVFVLQCSGLLLISR